MLWQRLGDTPRRSRIGGEILMLGRPLFFVLFMVFLLVAFLTRFTDDFNWYLFLKEVQPYLKFEIDLPSAGLAFDG